VTEGSLKAALSDFAGAAAVLFYLLVFSTKPAPSRETTDAICAMGRVRALLSEKHAPTSEAVRLAARECGADEEELEDLWSIHESLRSIEDLEERRRELEARP
jgi:hypothetical protein